MAPRAAPATELREPSFDAGARLDCDVLAEGMAEACLGRQTPGASIATRLNLAVAASGWPRRTGGTLLPQKLVGALKSGKSDDSLAVRIPVDGGRILDVLVSADGDGISVKATSGRDSVTVLWTPYERTYQPNIIGVDASAGAALAILESMSGIWSAVADVAARRRAVAGNDQLAAC